VVVTVVEEVEDLINTGEEVGVKDRLECGSDKGDPGSIDVEDVNTRDGIRDNAYVNNEESIMGSNQKRIHREWNTRGLYSFQRA